MSLSGIFPIEKWDFQSESIMAALSPEDFDLLTLNQTEQVYRKGEIIFREGGYPSGIYYMTSGKAKKYKIDREGKEQIIYVANTGELIGYHAILSEDRYPDSAAALEKSTITFIPKDDFLMVLQQSDTLSKRLLKTLSHEFAVLINGLTLFGQRSVRERLALQLVVLREKYKIDFHPGMPVVINMSREDLASLTGTVRENVVRILTEFKQEEILRTEGRKIIILNVNKLVEIANYK
jgi:CRP-like cAMP-binding protein